MDGARNSQREIQAYRTGKRDARRNREKAMEKLLKRSRVAMKKSDKAGPGFSKEKSPESSGGFPGTLQAMTILRSESSGFSLKLPRLKTEDSL